MPTRKLWINRDLANLARERVLKVEASRAGAPPLVLTRAEGPDGKLAVTTPAEAPPTEEAAVEEIGRAFEFLTFTEVRKESPAQPLGEARFTLTDNLSITVTGAQEGEAVWLRLAAAGDDEAARLNARWRGWAYQISAYKVKALLPQLADLLKPPAP